MAVGRLPLGTLVTGTKGPAPKRGLWSQACLANLAKNTPVTLLASVEMATEVFQKHPGTLAGQAWGKLLGAGGGSSLRGAVYIPFSTSVLQDYVTPEIILYSEEGLQGEQVKLMDALEDSQGLDRPLQVASATVSAGL